MKLSKEKEKRREQVAKYVAKQEAAAEKQAKKEKKAAELLKAQDKKSKAGYVTASTAAVLSPKKIKEINDMDIKSIGETLMEFENKTGKKGSAVYGDWLGRQYYSSLINGKIKKPDKRVALGLAIAFSLKGQEFIDFVADLGYSFPKERRDYVIKCFIESSDYDTRSFGSAKGTPAEIDRMRYLQTMNNIDELDEMIHDYDKKCVLICGKSRD